MRSWLALTLMASTACTLNTHSNVIGGEQTNSSTQGKSVRGVFLDGGGAALDAQPSAAADAGEATSIPTGVTGMRAAADSGAKSPPLDAADHMPTNDPTHAASAGAAGTQAAGAQSLAGAGAMTTAGAAAAPNKEEALIEVLTEKADKNPPNEVLLRTLIVQLSSPLPPNATTLRSLLTVSASFDCANDPHACDVVCEYAGANCLTCFTDQNCRAQFWLVCANRNSSCF